MHSIPPEQNGVAERKNRTLMEVAKSMLSSASLPKQFWAEAVDTASYVLNRIPDRVGLAYFGPQ